MKVTTTLVCPHCSGHIDVQAAAAHRPQPSTEVELRTCACGGTIRGNYATCYACSMHPTRTPGVCVSCGGPAGQYFAECKPCYDEQQAVKAAADSPPPTDPPAPPIDPFDDAEEDPF
ncbi:MAG: hypothetical protein OXQ29_26365 [Rhodospirillaceae bacterium]|nr:hypothetical protein [Rhodospirillaceae bacterium]